MEHDFRRDEDLDAPGTDETRPDEHERIRSSNDRDQASERAGERAPHNQGYDEAVSGRARDTDPDRARSDVDRNDTVAE